MLLKTKTSRYVDPCICTHCHKVKNPSDFKRLPSGKRTRVCRDCLPETRLYRAYMDNLRRRKKTIHRHHSCARKPAPKFGEIKICQRCQSVLSTNDFIQGRKETPNICTLCKRNTARILSIQRYAKFSPEQSEKRKLTAQKRMTLHKENNTPFWVKAQKQSRDIQQRNRDNLSIIYIRSYLVAKSNLKAQDIPPELILLERERIRLVRNLKEM